MSVLWGFIGGLLASIFITGGRSMLAPIIFRRKLHVGNITKSEHSPQQIAWRIPVEVKASAVWKLVTTAIHDVRAILSYTKKDGEKTNDMTIWMEPEMCRSSITMQIGGIYYGILVAEIRGGGQLLPLDGRTGGLFLDNQDIILELVSGNTSLGRWRYKGAIKGGTIHEVAPIKVRGSILVDENEEEKSR